MIRRNPPDSDLEQAWREATRREKRRFAQSHKRTLTKLTREFRDQEYMLKNYVLDSSGPAVRVPPK
jgi:hypothetical protein